MNKLRMVFAVIVVLGMPSIAAASQHFPSSDILWAFAALLVVSLILGFATAGFLAIYTRNKLMWLIGIPFAIGWCVLFLFVLMQFR